MLSLQLKLWGKVLCVSHGSVCPFKAVYRPCTGAGASISCVRANVIFELAIWGEGENQDPALTGITLPHIYSLSRKKVQCFVENARPVWLCVTAYA